jgi:para-nitrobenzyl esterase
MSFPVVNTRSGRISGVEKNGVMQFRGIPFALPLKGLGRIRAPEPVEPWQGVLAATGWAPAAPQDEIPFMPVGKTGDGCLALNIWRPLQITSPLPVMVWIHGGGFSAGASNQSLYDGSVLARENGVIVVSFNYRLGILGFGEWSDWPELNGVSNAGLRDQILALQWVRDHIADFGGDPDAVTLFGESAGGMSIACLMASPLAAGLFARAIIQSGSPDHVVTVSEAARITRLFAEAAGGDPAACLQGELKGIVRAQRSCFRTTVHRGLHAHPVAQFGMTLLPRLGDDVLPEHPLSAMTKGASASIPLMLGTTLDEWTLFYLSPQSMGQSGPRPEPDEERLLHEFERTLPGQGRLMLSRYREEMPQASGSELFCAYETDRMFRIPSIRLAEARFGQPGPTWQYLFDWPCAFNRRLKSCHVMEVPFVFGITDKPAGQFFTGGEEQAAQLSRQVRQAWSGFARGMAPGAEGWPEWPVYEEKRREVMLMAATSSVLQDPESGRRRLWKGVL